MNKILIVSDTHGRIRNLQDTWEKLGRLDLIIHLGDVEGGKDLIKKLAPCPVEFVMGNCDFYNDLPYEKVIEIGKYKAFLTHGHKYFVRDGVEYLANAAKQKGCQIAMYGHTHVAKIHYEDGITVINPGSLTLPKPYGSDPTYILMEIDRDGEAHFSIGTCSGSGL